MADSVQDDTNEKSLPKQQLQALLQLRALYELTTQISKGCFDACIGRINPRLEDSESVCITNCAANYLQMKLFMAQRLVSSVRQQHQQHGDAREANNE